VEPTPAEKKEALREWRERHFEEMEANMRVAKAVRDDPLASKKDRIEAVKIITRMLGNLQQDAPAPKIDPKKAEDHKKESELTLEQIELVQSLLPTKTS
jgi:hypothetical protein